MSVLDWQIGFIGCIVISPLVLLLVWEIGKAIEDRRKSKYRSPLRRYYDDMS